KGCQVWDEREFFYPTPRERPNTSIGAPRHAGGGARYAPSPGATMPKTKVTCPHCSTAYSVDETLLGKRGRCKHCGESFALSRWSAGAVVLDDFEVERPLGQGGMGAVYLVRSRSGGQRFALKTILASRFA